MSQELPVPPPFAPLAGRRGVVRQWKEEDKKYEAVAVWNSDERYCKFIAEDGHEMVPNTVEKAGKLFDMCASPVGEVYAVADKETDEVVGNCGIFLGESFESRSIGFGIAPEHWGKGYATDAVRTLLRHLFDSNPAPSLESACAKKTPAGKWEEWDGRIITVLADTHVENVAAQQVMLRAGMRVPREGELELDSYKQSRFVAVMQREDWEASK
mmetsp:Transcript_17709/g.68703  ORF Transcript_17709/g.68703 Transcript_17709/m.68703 type:complete len:213 (-) Transcript_17709:1717-2355(-)